ncbi:hypothetical protein BSKO_02315 [Bryopsis sp. KO-2023]|nr:hypothetical protein BSKO_02315 [Bryopsis sp. KO-2023]
MNPLTQIKNTQKATRREWEAGLSESASWHARFKHSAYIFAGGLNFELTEGDLLAVFSQYGEVVDATLFRDKDTGKSRGFAFLAYENQSSTVLAVDNLSGAKVAGRIIRVEHVADYKRKIKELGGEVEEDDATVSNRPEISTIDAPRWGKVDDAPQGNIRESPAEAPGSVMELMKAHLRKKNQEMVTKAGEEEKKRKKDKKERRKKDKHKHTSRKGDSKRRRSRSRSRSRSPTDEFSGRERRYAGRRGEFMSAKSIDWKRYSRTEGKEGDGRSQKRASDHQTRSTYRKGRD